MAIPNDYIDKITNKDSGESRIISPAADKVRVDNENFEGTDLDEVLDEVANAIEEAGSGDGTVTGVKVGNTTYEPTEGVVDLSTPIGDKVDKETGKGLSSNDYTTQEKNKLQSLPTADSLSQQLGNKANDNAVVKSISVNGGQAQTPTQGNVNIQVSAGDQVSVIQPNPADGTFIIRVGSNDYTINLNHTHENMAKIVKCTEATLPQTLDNDTIYVQVDNATTPSEIECLYLFGLEFTGGFAPGTPRLVSPSNGSTFDLGRTSSGSASTTVTIKAKDLTQSLVVEFGSGSTGYSFDTSDLPSGVTYDSNTDKLTITKEAACSINGVDIVVIYSGTDDDENAEGTIGISSSSVDGINVEVSLIVNKVSFEMIAYWEGADEPSGGKWFDEINNIPIELYGTAAKTSEGYQLNNLSAPKNAYCYLPAGQNSFFNSQIDKEFLCIVDCKVKFSATETRALIIDFGSYGSSLSNLSIGCILRQNGTIYGQFKRANEQSGFSDSVVTDNTGTTFALGTYVDVQVRLGARILKNGKQELFFECGSGRAYAVLDTPVTFNFNGVSATPTNPSVFGLGIAYISKADANAYAPAYLSDVVYKSIQISRKQQ